jgi:hypothetical protein
VNLWAKIRLARQANKLAKVAGEEAKLGYDPWISAVKGLKSVLVTSIGIAVPVLVGYYLDPEHVVQVLVAGGVSFKLATAAAPLITGLLRFADNWRQNRHRVASP